MIRNEQALRPQYIPETLQHRDAEVDAFRRVFEPLTDDRPPHDCFIDGPVGVGKTTLAKSVLQRVESEGYAVEWGYTNCNVDDTPNSVLDSLTRDLSITPAPPEGTPRSTFLRRLSAHDTPIVAVIDEVDKLADPGLLASLYETRGVATVYICVSKDAFFADLADRVRSRLWTAKDIRLDQYSQRQLVDILRARVQAALSGEPVSQRALETIADLAAGNARDAILILRHAVDVALDRDADEVTAEIARAAEPSARRALVEANEHSLGTDEEWLYHQIRQEGPVRSHALHAAYEEAFADGKSRRMRRNYLIRLQDMGLIEREGLGRKTTYRVPSRPPGNRPTA